MSFNFFKNFAKVKVEEVESGMINLAATLDKEGVAEAAILQKIEEHNERIKMQQQASADYQKEKLEFEQEKSLYDRYMHEAETIQGLIESLAKAKTDIATDPNNQSAAEIISKYNEETLTSDLSKIISKVEERAPILEQEKQDVTDAENWLKEVKSAVDQLSKELLELRQTVDQAKRDIQKAELEKEKNQKRAEQAEVLAGLKKSGNKFDVAINALKNKATEERNEAEAFKIKADSLSKAPEENLVGKYTTDEAPIVNESLTERLAKLKNKA